MLNIIQVTDFHLKHSEAFFKAGVALDNYLIEELKKESEPFIFLDSGDHFHTSKETGRVNNEVVRFFLEIVKMPMCECICVMQGNHDVKEDTGSALDLLRGLDKKIKIIDKPIIMYAGKDTTSGIYLLPHLRPYSLPLYSTIKSYGSEEFHKKYWESLGYDWENDVKSRIKMVVMHGGDETTGRLFMSADISFLPSLRSNGHVHKAISKSCLPSIAVTRRDEADKKCIMRKINTKDFSFSDTEIPLFLNYAHIKYGDDVNDYFASGVHIMPKESLVVDIYGHDDKDVVIAEYTEKWKDTKSPHLYIGDVTPVERRIGECDDDTEDSDFLSINVEELFKEFCKEKGISQIVADDVLKRISNENV